MFVCVVRRVGFEVLFKYALACEVAQRIFYCRVGLQRHTAFQAVYVEPGNNGLFGIVVGLLVHYRRKCGNLLNGEPDSFGLLTAFLVPK